MASTSVELVDVAKADDGAPKADAPVAAAEPAAEAPRVSYLRLLRTADSLVRISFLLEHLSLTVFTSTMPGLVFHRRWKSDGCHSWRMHATVLHCFRRNH